MTGCASYLPFTQELRSEHALQPADLQNLQFYTSHDITLRREVRRGGRTITGSHKLLLIAGKQVEEVVIAKHTPGVIVGVSPTTLKVSFEEGSSLEFALRGPPPLDQPVVAVRGGFAEPPDPFPGNRPAPIDNHSIPLFLGSGNYFLLPDGAGTIEFQGQIYEAVEETPLTYLVISSESLEEVEEQKTVLPGRKL